VGVQPRLSGDVRTRTCGRLGFGATKQPIRSEPHVRVTTAFNKMLSIPGAAVASVEFTPEGVLVGLRRHRGCPRCPCGWRGTGGPARARLVNQSVQPVGDEPTTPLPDGGLRHPQLRRHALVVRSARAGQHDLRAQRQCLRRFRPPRPRSQLRPPCGQLLRGSGRCAAVHLIQRSRIRVKAPETCSRVIRSASSPSRARMALTKDSCCCCEALRSSGS